MLETHNNGSHLPTYNRVAATSSPFQRPNMDLRHTCCAEVENTGFAVDL
jgi:hypothetical protein